MGNGESWASGASVGPAWEQISGWVGCEICLYFLTMDVPGLSHRPGKSFHISFSSRVFSCPVTYLFRFDCFGNME